MIPSARHLSITIGLALMLVSATFAGDMKSSTLPKSTSKNVITKAAPVTATALKKPEAKKLPLQQAPVEVKAANGKPTVLEFGAAWCVPCKVFAPVFEKVKTAYSGQVDFQSHDSEAGEGEKLANKFAVSGLPTVIILDPAGKVIFRKSGIMDEKALSAEVAKAIAK